MKRSSFLRGRGVRFATPGGMYAGIVVVFVVFLLLVLRLLAPDALLALASPLLRLGTVSSASVASVGSVFENKATLQLDVERLALENARLTTENATLRARTADLTKLLGTRTERGTGILSGIIARPPVSPYDVLVIDSGTDEGVVPNALVFGAGGMPIGAVASASKQNARVLLFSSPGKETEAWVGDARSPITLTGQGSGAMIALVPRELPVLYGDSVYVTGPGAMPIGTVVEVQTDPASPKSRVLIRPLANPFSITWVTVERKTL